MEERKGLAALLYQVMAATVVQLVEDGELDQGRGISWIDLHTVNLVEEGENKYRAEIIVEAVEAEEDEDADSP